LNKSKTTEREYLAMVYALHKFRHYLLGKQFKMFTDHSTLKYLVKRIVLGGRICIWILLFQEFDFEVIVKPEKMNVGPDHLLRVTNGKEPTNLVLHIKITHFNDYLLSSLQVLHFGHKCHKCRKYHAVILPMSYFERHHKNT
jgi:hypothetical protein